MEIQLKQVERELTYTEKSPLAAGDMQLVNNDLLSEDEVRKIQKCISGDYRMYTIAARHNYVDLYNKRLAAPYARYYLLADKWNTSMQGIYYMGGDAAMYHKWTSVPTRNPCDSQKCKNKEVRKYYFYAPGLKEKYANVTTIEGFVWVHACESCYTDKRCTLPYDNYVQQAYNKDMYFSKSLILLLCVHSREQDNVFHADNLPRDVFKLILRFVFPPAFLTIK